jgi:hypothetical protein
LNKIKQNGPARRSQAARSAIFIDENLQARTVRRQFASMQREPFFITDDAIAKLIDAH